MEGALSAPDLAALVALVRDRGGQNLSGACRTDIAAALRTVGRRAGLSGESECLRRLRDDYALLDDLVGELAVGESYFFRGADQFAYLSDEAIPEVRRLRGPDHALRFWSAGCAGGEEPYSLAILLEETGLAGQARILATDISAAALARARTATYGKWSLRENGPGFARRYFRTVAGDLRLAARFVSRVAFARHNLVRDPGPELAGVRGAMDIVLCRNVLIYFDESAIGTVARRLYDALAEGGLLMTGPSDPPLGAFAPFEVMTGEAGPVYRRPKAAYRPAVSEPGTMTAAASVDAPQAIRRARPPTYEKAVPGAAEAPDGDAAAVVLEARELADAGRTEAAAALLGEAVARHPDSAELAFLQAVVLMSLRRHGDAEPALRRVLYLDRSLPVAHFALATTLQHLGRADAAGRAYRNARDLAAARPPDEILALSEGERAASLVAAASALLSAIGESTEARP